MMISLANGSKGRLPKLAPEGMKKKAWCAYRETVRQVGFSHSRRPYPNHPFWNAMKVKRPRGRAKKDHEWDMFCGWVREEEGQEKA